MSEDIKFCQISSTLDEDLHLQYSGCYFKWRALAESRTTASVSVTI